jgi:hypothetical protein
LNEASAALDHERTPDSTRTRIPPKQNQIKPSKKAWISLVLFVRIGTFQWGMSEKIKKFDSSQVVCKTSQGFNPLISGSRPHPPEVPDSVDWEMLAHDSGLRKKLHKNLIGNRIDKKLWSLWSLPAEGISVGN